MFGAACRMCRCCAAVVRGYGPCFQGGVLSKFVSTTNVQRYNSYSEWVESFCTCFSRFFTWWPCRGRVIGVALACGRRGVRRRFEGVGTAKVIHEVSSLNEIIVPGRVQGALQVGRKAPLRVFASERKRVVLGGCSPVKRLGAFTTRCTRTLMRAAKLATYVASHSRIITTYNDKDQRLRKGRVDSSLSTIVTNEGNEVIDRSDERGVSIVSSTVSSFYRGVVRPVLYTDSTVKTIVLLAGDRGATLKSARHTLVHATTNFLNERVRRWGYVEYARGYIRVGVWASSTSTEDYESKEIQAPKEGTIMFFRDRVYSDRPKDREFNRVTSIP